MTTDEEWLALRRACTRNLKLRALEYSDERDRELYEPVHDPAHDPVHRLARTIEDNEAESAQLVAGFRGTGKTTEFSRLAAYLKARGYLVIRIDLDAHLDHHSPVDVQEFLLTLTGALAERLFDPALLDTEEALRHYFWHRMKGFLSDDIVEVLTERDAAGNVVRSAEREARRQDEDFRERVRKGVGSRVPLLERVIRDYHAEVLAALERRHGHARLVVIVDSLEHVRGTWANARAVQDSVRELFLTHGRRLAIHSAHVVFSVPAFMALYADNVVAEFAGALVAWSAFHVQRRQADGGALARDPAILDRLASLVERRMDWRRFLTSREELDRVILASGGSMRDLLKMLAEAVAAVDGPNDPPVQASTPIAALQRSYPTLWKDEVEALRAIAQHRGFDGLESEHREKVAGFLDAGVVLCYLNGDFWYDVHPLVKPRLGPL